MGNWGPAIRSESTSTAILKASVISASALLAAMYLVACVEGARGTVSPSLTETHSIVAAGPEAQSPAPTETRNTVTTAPEPSPTSTEIPRPTPTPRRVECTQTRILVAGVPVPSEMATYDFYYLLCIDGSSIEVLTKGGPYYDPSISPINKLVAFAVEKEIAVLDLSGNVVQVIEVSDHVQSPSWSPNGKFIVYIHDRQYLEVVHLETGVISESLIPAEFRHPQEVVAPSFENVAWSPDGKHLALNTNYNSLFLLDVTCSAESHVCSAENFHLLANRIDGKFSWSPDSEEIVVEYLDAVSYAPSLRIIDLQGHVVREYLPTELKQFTSLEFSFESRATSMSYLVPRWQGNRFFRWKGRMDSIACGQLTGQFDTWANRVR